MTEKKPVTGPFLFNNGEGWTWATSFALPNASPMTLDHISVVRNAVLLCWRLFACGRICYQISY